MFRVWVSNSLSRRPVTITIVILALLGAEMAQADFWTIRGKGQLETVTLTRDLPPVAARKGSTVQFLPEIAGNSIPSDTAIILRNKIQTLLMNSKAGAIQLVESSPDTIIKCIITGYEPKIVRQYQRDVGSEHLMIATWIGNIEASVQVFDKQNRPIDSANLKSHLEKDYVLAKKEDQVTSMTDKKTSWRDRIGGAITTAKGGADLGDIAGKAGGGQKMHDALADKEQLERTPTELEWKDMLIESLAAKVANRIVPVKQDFIAILPLDKEFQQARDLAKAQHWAELEEQMDKMPPVNGAGEAYRLYLLGLSYEAQACIGSEAPKAAAEQLNKATKYYDDAHKLRPAEHELFLAQIRAQDSLDHYLEIEHALEIKSHEPPPDDTAKSSRTGSDVADNKTLIDMAQAKMPDDVLLTYVQTVQDPKFDTSAPGLMEMSRAGVSSKVIAAAQKRMLAAKQHAPVVHSRAVPQSH